jgi:Flp pilus assembly protein TadG
MARIRARKKSGQGLAEAVAVAIVLIPLAFCLFDFIVLIIANSMNDTLVKNCARAAANQDTEPKALDAAKKSIASFHPSTLINSDSMVLSGFDYNPTKGYVTAQTTMKVHLPMPFPGYSDLTFEAQDAEPIVNFNPN